ncbi:hypothetical protein BDZ45DRAFT_699782 [Acephala macrosclerotiorum]|nr:hypothetical protein BDZ45DRAFT_699782 [Acephala macrosclerotiorum]
MIKQLLVKVYADLLDTNPFLPPKPNETHTATVNEMKWAVVAGNDRFMVEGGDKPSLNDHSLLGRIYLITPATSSKDKPPVISPGTSILGDSIVILRIEGALNPTFKMTGTEILVNPPPGIASSDVIKEFTISK